MAETAQASQIDTTAPSAFREAFQRALAHSADAGTAWAALRAAAHACRDELATRWLATQAQDRSPGAPRRVHYMSMEFLTGRMLGNALAALGLEGVMQEALAGSGQAHVAGSGQAHVAGSGLASVAGSGRSLADVLESESEPGLGNGGLGRLAACFLDAFATLGLPSFGYGVRYEYGMFAQAIDAAGRQVEHPDHWMRLGNPWEIVRPELRYRVGFGGHVEGHGSARRWVPEEHVFALAYDTIVPGHGTRRVSTLRLWSAGSDDGIDFATFCRGQHLAAGQHRLAADLLNWVLYPDDRTEAGRVLRLKQEHLLVSASMQDLLARHLRERGTLVDLGLRNAVHLNDTHPALTPLELMRLLLDEHAVPWSDAWAITRQALSYTNHTLLPEALETWPIRMLEELLPRHLEIAYEINHRHLEAVRERFPDDGALAGRLSLIEHNGEDRLRMAALSIVASHRVNGVSALHSDLMVKTIFADFARLAPDRFINVTNGVTPRRWLAQANPALSRVLDTRLGTDWRVRLDRLGELGRLADDAALGRELMAAKRVNKQRLATLVQRQLNLALDTESLFDVQVKRIHEYKRQLLNLMHVVARYQAIVANPDADWTPRTVVIAGKAASAYQTAKTIVRLIHDVARVVNADARVRDRLKLVFLPNYGVSLAEVIMPAADLSEQISMAGTEASGTGNMKLALNGALTIGTWDGANVEMAQAMGERNLFVFGLRAEGVAQAKARGYVPREHAERDASLSAVLRAVAGGEFSPDEPGRYRALIDSLLDHDTYMVLADFTDYVATQRRVDTLYRQPQAWAAMAWRNIAAMGRFSIDRTVQEYLRLVWSRERQ